MKSSLVLLDDLKKQLDFCMLRDRFSLRKKLLKIEKNQFKDDLPQSHLGKLNEQIERSCLLRKQREEKQLKIAYPSELPVCAEKQNIVRLLEQNQVLIVAGETGSGKTTQLPKMCLEAGFGRKAMIGHTQPRRLAASTVARRIAQELGEENTDTVGFQVRFTDKSSDTSLIKLMTDGILLAEIANDPFLDKYDLIIIDEAHERSLNIDFLLGYLKRLLPRRKDLKLIITSATIDVKTFSEFFNKAPIIEVSGKTWPVDVAWYPAEHWSENDLSVAVLDAIKKIIDAENHGETHHKGGDVLVFLPGEKEIRDTHKILKQSKYDFEVLPLYARLNFSEQHKVFQQRSGGMRRIVLATNVAETSLTVPGIFYVIDSGLVRMSRYSYRNKLQQLPIEQVSQASANQRVGRCGRVAPGLAVRLYSEQEYVRSDLYTSPEIMRTNLAAVILRMEFLHLGHVQDFDFIEMPDKRQINDGYRLLQEISAVDQKRKITALGKKIAQLPCDPRIARMLLEASQKGALNEVLVIASALSIQDPREIPSDKRESAQQVHQTFMDKRSDFVSFINLWNFVEQQRQDLSASQFKKLCLKKYLSWPRLREWREVHRQLLLFCKNLKLNFNQTAASYDAIHQSILSGLVSQIGMRDEQGYLGVRNRRFLVFPGSSLKKTKAKWLMAAELVETSQVYARQVAEIDPQWLLAYAEPLFKKSYSEPWYNSGKGQVLAKQNLTLYGLPVVVGESVNYASINAELCREIFIRQALVEGSYKYRNSLFFKNNQGLLNDLGEYEIRQRRPDLLVDDQVVYEFYDALIPHQVVNLAGFESWRKGAEQKNPKLLFLEKKQLLAKDFSDADKAMFPNDFTYQDLKFPLTYRFRPGQKDDGVTVDIPLAVLNRLPDYLFDRLVPGLFEEKLLEMLRLLPKNIRKHLVPIPDFVKQCHELLKFDEQPLTEAVSALINDKKSLKLDFSHWPLDKLDDYYYMRIRLLDDQGEHLESSRSLQELKKQYRSAAQNLLKKGGDSSQGIQKKDIVSWNFPDIPPIYKYQQSGIEVYSYPALVDKGETVAIELFDSESLAMQQHWRGLARLVLLEDRKQWRYLKTLFNKSNSQQLQARYFISFNELIDDALLVAVRQSCFSSIEVFSADEFHKLTSKGRSNLVNKVKKLVNVQQELFSLRYQLEQLLLSPSLKHHQSVEQDIRQQLNKILPDHFFVATPEDLIPELPRYLKAMVYRLENLQGQLNKDRESMKVIQLFEARVKAYLADKPHALEENSAFVHFVWMIEELRVSLFAQGLGTRLPVSKKRLERLWSETIAE